MRAEDVIDAVDVGSPSCCRPAVAPAEASSPPDGDLRVTDIPAREAAIGALDRIRGVARTRTTVVLSTEEEGRHG